MKLSKKSLILAVVAGVAVVAAVLGVVIWKVQPKGAVAAVSTLPDSLNPVLEQNTSGLNASELIFDGLTNFEVDPASGRLYTELGLAENIVQNQKDKKTYTITLREDVMWHDETPLMAEDVVYSYNAYVLEENKSPKRDYINSFIESCKAIDDKTVEIVFKNPMPEFRAYPVLTFKIVPSRFEGKEMDVNMREGELERRFATEPIGTGPFKLTKWEIGKWLTFTANGLYFKSRPKVDSIVIKRVIDPIVRMNELKKGRINLVLETNPMDRDNVAKMSKVDINSYMPYAFYNVSINTSLFPKAEGRQAMAMALNKTKLVPGITDKDEGVVLNYGLFPSNLFAMNIPEYVSDPLPDRLPYDLSKAKKLAKTGDISGQNAKLIYPDSMGEFGKELAEGIAKQLAEIGLNVEVKRTGDQVYKRMIFKEKSYELALMYYEGFDNIYSSIGNIYRSNGSENITGIANKELDSLFDKWEKAVVTEKWIELTLQLNQKVCDLSPTLPLCSLQKDVYSRGLANVAIGTDNPFLSAEDWKFKD
ncbi:MAG: ABC transporter substrate-binding protein [Treponema sp.]|nr:ABC transporter substrate-binding protein [Treponema sp.]